MKKLFFTLLTSISLFSFGQAPQEISYQGVARNTTGSVLPNQNIGIKLDLHQGSAAGTIVFSESHNKTTNAFGLFTLGIGSSNTAGFTAINWASGPYFLEVSLDPAGGTSYTSVGTQQFMSVPYALYAQTAGNASATPTITINAPNTVTSAGGSFIINVPAALTYTAGNGIDITGGVISNTATAITPTISAGNNITISPTTPSNSYTVNAPSYSLSQTGNNIDLLQNGTSIGTATLPLVTSYSAGNGIAISSGVISNTLTPITPTLSVTGNSISINPGNSQALPNYSLTQSGANIDLTQNGTSIATVTLTAATSTSLSAGSSNILLNQSGNAYTITPVTPTFTNSGPTTITGSYPNYTVNSIASPSTTLVQGNNVTLNNSGSTYTVSAPAYSITLPGGNVVQITNGVSTSTAPISATNLTLNGVNNNILSAGGNTVGLNTYTAGTGISISGVAPNYTLSSSNQSLTINSNSLSITGGNTVVVPTSSVVSGNANITVTPSGNTYSVSAPSYSISSGTGSISITNGVSTSTAPIVVPVLSYTGSATSGTLQSGTQTVTIPNYTLSNTSNTITLNNGTANSTAIIPVPTLTLSGTTLQSGPATNTVSLSSLNGIYGGSGALQTGSTTVTVGTNTLTFLSGATAGKSIANFYGGGITGTHLAVGHINANPASIKLLGSVSSTPVDYGYVSGSTNGIAISGGTSSNGLYVTNTAEVGVGTFTTGTGKFVITHTASQANPTIHLRETSGALSRIKFSNTGVANRFFEAGASVNAADNFSAYSISFHDGTNYKSRFLIYGNGKTSINNMHTALTTFHVMDDDVTSPGIAAEGFGFSGQMNVTRNNPLGVSPTYTRGAVAGLQDIGKINFSAYDGATYGDGAKIYAKTTEPVTGSNKGTELIFAAVPTGTNSNKDAFKINGANQLEVISGLKIPSGAAIGSVLTSTDAAGNAAWQPLSTPAAAWTSTLGNTYLVNSGDKVGIGTNTPNSPFQVLNYVSFEINGSNTSLGFNSGTGTSPNNYYNTFVGHNSGQAVGSGTASANSFLGYFSGKNNLNGSGNTFLGALSGNSNTNGNNNTYVGSYSGVASTSGASNVFIGYNSGANNISAGNNTFIGTNADLSSTTQYTNASAIGYNAKVNANDALILGNSATKVGIGTTAPLAKLQIDKTALADIPLILNSPSGIDNVNWNFKIGSSSVATDPKSLTIASSSSSADFGIIPSSTFPNAFVVKGLTGNIGINSSNPASRLTVIGDNTNNIATIYAVNSGSTTVAASHAIWGTTSNSYSLSAGVFGENSSAGPAIFGSKGATHLNGSAGRFEILNTNNSADGVFVSTSGKGAAIHAVNGPTVTGSSNTAILLENGHMDITQSGPGTGISSADPLTSGYAGATDVAGTIETYNPFIILTGVSGSVTVFFGRNYKYAPVVTVTATSDLFSKLDYYVTSTASSFTINYKNNTGLSINIAASVTQAFSYHVIGIQ